MTGIVKEDAGHLEITNARQGATSWQGKKKSTHWEGLRAMNVADNTPEMTVTRITIEDGEILGLGVPHLALLQGIEVPESVI